MIYQSSNNCRINNQYQSKSVGKNNQKKLTCNNNISLEKHHNRDILLRTEAKGFYIEGSEDKLGYSESPMKTNDLGWQSTSQLPFLLMASNNQADQRLNLLNKKKAQITFQKSISNSTKSSNTKTQVSFNPTKR